LFELQQDITDGANLYVTRVAADTLYARVNDARITNALSKIANLAELNNIPEARSNLGLGNSATRDVGTSSSTVAQGDAVPLHVAATDPHGDRAYADQNFLSVNGGVVNGAVTLTTGALTLQAGGLTVTNGTTTLNGAVSVNGNIVVAGGVVSNYGASVGSRAFVTAVGGDNFDRWHILSNGFQQWSDGTTTPDTNLYRASANVLATDDDFAITTAGKGLKVKEGTNARMGTATLVAGTIVVANTSVTATTRIFLTVQTAGGTQGFLRISARTAGTSFTITSTSVSETSTVAWLLVEPA
jgi:hypothetical protein